MIDETQSIQLLHNIDDSVKKACKKDSLLEALTFVAICEMDRIVEQVRTYPGPWDSCFSYRFQRVFEEYPMKIVEEIMNS